MMVIFCNPCICFRLNLVHELPSLLLERLNRMKKCGKKGFFCHGLI